MSGASNRSGSLIHATAIAIDGRAALLLGASGSGKSDLALRCLMLEAHLDGHPLRAELVADDQTLIEIVDGTLHCRAPERISGLIEVRGLGIVPFARRASAVVGLAVTLTSGPLERLPEPATLDLLGQSVPQIAIAPFEASAPYKLLLALARTVS